MERATFSLEGKVYPSRVTMGALRLFRQETGEDFLKKADAMGSDDLGVMLWASIKSQARVEGVEFGYTLDEFLDRVTPDEVSAWFISTGQAEQNGDESKKKTFPA